MKALGFLTRDKEKRTKWLRAFRIWQHRPYELKPLSEDGHICASCKTEFVGNFCPRCGQSAGVGRFSFKKAALLFLDVWGVGNRSMFRSIRDLVLRPGYMIRDYLRGMQSAYFPPFKMFFLLTALSLLVQNGFSFGLGEENGQQQNTEEVAKNPPAPPAAPVAQKLMNFTKVMDSIRNKNAAIFALLTLLMFTVPLYYFWRKTPTIPDLRYSEFVVALVYTSNMYSIYSIAANLLNSSLLKLLAVLMVFVALKQFSGFSKKRVLGHLILTVLISTVILVAIFGVSVSTFYFVTK